MLHRHKHDKERQKELQHIGGEDREAGDEQYEHAGSHHGKHDHKQKHHHHEKHKHTDGHHSHEKQGHTDEHHHHHHKHDKHGVKVNSFDKGTQGYSGKSRARTGRRFSLDIGGNANRQSPAQLDHGRMDRRKSEGNIEYPESDYDHEGAQVATSLLQQRANDVRSNRVNWQSYLQGQMISHEDFQFISKFDNANSEIKNATLNDNPQQFAKTMYSLMNRIAKDQTLQYILTMLDDVLQDDKSRVEIFKDYSRKNKESVWVPFLHLLNRDDRFIVNQTSRIIAKIACWGKELMGLEDLKFYLSWLKEQLRLPGNEYMQTAARCLQMMLRIDKYRQVFVDVDGISTIVMVLGGSKTGFQIQYQLIFCLWCLTFNPSLAERMNKYQVIPTLADILSETVKEKVSRIILATFRNLLEKPEEKEITTDHALSMVQCKVLKQLELLEARKFDDPDIVDDIEYLTEKLQSSIQDLSSFDEYTTEVKSGRLEWSPVHKSDRFWRENCIRLNEKNYELLKILVRLLETSKDPLILSVAAHDLGEYVRHYPRGKNVIEQLGGKQLVMQYLAHEDPNVRFEALIAVQKLMVHNWEYLGRQLEASDKPKDSSQLVSAKA